MKNSKEFFGVLSDTEILKYIKKKQIIIDPFKKENLNNCSYDVTLGEYYFREKVNGLTIANPYSSMFNKQFWMGPLRARTVEELISSPKKLYNFISKRAKQYGLPGRYIKKARIELEKSFENISLKERIILIFPGEMILAHTNEFIGGRNSINTSMQTRSSWARSFIDVCRSAGWGDIGYINRWTMEITNHSHTKIIPLVVGRRIAQIVFLKSTTPLRIYGKDAGTKYQQGLTLRAIKKNWKPEMMLPRLFIDRDINHSNQSS